MDIEDEKIINEIIGLTTGTVRRPTAVVAPARPAQHQRPVAGINISYSHKLYGWQSQVVDTMTRGKDVYVIATPSAGKTLPIVTYWARQFLGINPELLATPRLNNPQQVYNGLMNLFLNPERIPKLLFLVPVRSLVYNTFDDFISKFSELFWVAIQRATSLQDIDLIVERLVRYKGGDQLVRIKQAKQSLMNAKAHNSITQEEYTQRSLDLQNVFMKQLEITIPDFVMNTLVYGKTGVGSAGNANPKVAPVIITIYESIESIFNAIKNQLGVAVIDEAHLTQHLADEIQTRTIQIVDKLYWFIEKLPKRTRLAFLSGTINPAAAHDLSEYLGACYGRSLQILNDAPIGNPATIKVVPADWTSDDKALVREMINPRMSNTVMVIFSKARIDRLIDAALGSHPSQVTASQVSQGIYQRPKLATFNDEKVKKDLNFQISAGAENIKDERLARAVSSGFGWIYRPEEGSDIPPQLTREQQQDFMIVADLFKNGKIKTLLATDAIGIGVNIDVQRMIIPSTERFDGSQMRELPVSKLAQLLNRTGRQAFKIGVVYTCEENVGNIVHALSIGPEQFETRVTLEKIPRSLCYARNFGRSIWAKMKRIKFTRPNTLPANSPGTRIR